MGMDLPMVIYAPAGLNMMQVRLQKLGFSVWMEIEDWFTEKIGFEDIICELAYESI